MCLSVFCQRALAIIKNFKKVISFYYFTKASRKRHHFSLKMSLGRNSFWTDKTPGATKYTGIYNQHHKKNKSKSFIQHITISPAHLPQIPGDCKKKKKWHNALRWLHKALHEEHLQQKMKWLHTVPYMNTVDKIISPCPIWPLATAAMSHCTFQFKHNTLSDSHPPPPTHAHIIFFLLIRYIKNCQKPSTSLFNQLLHYQPAKTI